MFLAATGRRLVMTVIVEGLALVVRRVALEARYDGGTKAFISGTCHAPAARFVCADREIVSVCFATREDTETAAIDLTRAGLLASGDEGSGDFALVEENCGPTAPCAWLGWVRPADRP